MAGHTVPALDLRGPGAPPRANGELQFAAPWESRAFGLAMALHAEGAFEWEAFRRRLIAEIAAWESLPDPKPPWSYYTCWLRALESLLADSGLVARADLRMKTRAFAARPHGHDHRAPAD